MTVYDDEGGIVNNVTIMFNNIEYISNLNGTVEITTPSVNKTKTYIISSTKQGYIDNSIIITVYPALSSENLIGFYIVIGICILIVVTIVIIMLRKYFKKKRINRF